MTEKTESHGQSRPKTSWVSDIGWPTKALIFTIVLLVGFFDHALGNWGAAVVPVALALFVPILVLRGLWNQPRFWVVVAFLAIVQAGLVFAIHPLASRLRLVFTLPFGVADCLLVIVIIVRVCIDGGAAQISRD